MPYKTLLGFCLIALLTTACAHAAREPADDERMIEDPRVQHRQYLFAPTGETLPYAVFVPSSYQASQPAPLIVALHGLGRTYDWMMGYDGFLEEAERYGYLVVAPLGYIRRGWYGSRPTENPLVAEYSEADVMAVLELMLEEFNVDRQRLYLWGHSMGGAGTYHLATENPGLFTALAVAAPAPRRDLSPTSLSVIRDTPILVLQGTEDELVPVELTREWVAAMRALGMPHLYVELEGEDHSNFVARKPENLRKVFNFFDTVQ